MSSKDFNATMTSVLVYEGGKVDDPHDPGGRTNQGVTQRVYSAYRLRKLHPIQDVYKMTNVERDEIYKMQYWDVIHGDSLPDGVDIAVMDAAVNSGCTQAAKWLQRALGLQKVDGVIGSVTIQAAKDYPDHDALVAAICDRRMAFLKALKTWSRYKGGWSARVANVKAKGQAWASGSVGPKPIYSLEGAKKAEITDAKVLPGKTAAGAVIGGGSTGTGMGVYLQSAQDQLAPYTSISFVQHIVAGLVIGGVVLTVAGFGWRYWAKHRENQLKDALDLPNAEATT